MEKPGAWFFVMFFWTFHSPVNEGFWQAFTALDRSSLDSEALQLLR